MTEEADRVLPVLAQLVEDPSVALSALKALGDLGSPKAVPVLEAVIASQNEVKLRREAEKARDKLRKALPNDK